MEVDSTTARPLGLQATPTPQSTPAPEPDQAKANDVNTEQPASVPEASLPMPVTSSQIGVVSAAVFKTSDSAVKLDSSAVSPAERTLKPYGISMLPEKAGETGPQQQNQPKNE